MVEYMFEISILKWEMERLNGKIARHYRAGFVRGEGEKQLLAGLAAVGSHILMSLGSALISTGERLSDRETSGRAAVA